MSVFSEALHTITTTKLEELAQQRTAFDNEHTALLAAAKAEQDPLKRLILLSASTKSCLGVKTSKSKDGQPGRVITGGTRNTRLETDLKNLDRFIEQAKFDPSVSPKVLEDWERLLLQYLSVQATKYEFADLYGKLVTEWLSSEKPAPADGDIEMSESFEELPGAKKVAARAEWEKSVFEPSNVDVPALSKYLGKVFNTGQKPTAMAMQRLRNSVEVFENSLSGPSQFTVPTLRWVIQGLQSSDLLPNDKREVLKDFLSNDVILGEIGDVLSMRLSALDRWAWVSPGDYVPLEQRKRLNGSFSIHMHEDVLQAMFLHYIGVRWSVFFKRAFRDIHHQDAWESNLTEIPKMDRMRRHYFLGSQWAQDNSTLESERGDRHRGTYFAHQLLDFETQQIEVADGEEEVEYGEHVQASRNKKRRFQRSVQQPMQAPRRQLATKAARMSSSAAVREVEEEKEEEEDEDMGFGLFDDDDYTPNQGPKRPMEAKQDLLHMLSSEIIISSKLDSGLSCFRGVFESWNPLLPHQTALEVLDFFGVSTKWKTFFTRFLQAPLKFIDDGPSTEPRLRMRGTPGSHAISDMLGEIVLFCLDFSINQSTDGALLHRLYDEFWFWNKDYEKCVKAWECVVEFMDCMGVKLNEDKTGSVRISKGDKAEPGNRLPQGEIRWGFLYLEPSNGRFEIDQKLVDSHIEELRAQLQGKSKSVIDWIQAWNSYAATFFSSNFGKASNCFGREHVDKMLATHKRIQNSILDGGNVVQHLKKMISERFGVSNVPDGFLFFPVELGGLDLQSPFVGLLQIRESVKENPYDLIDDFEEQELDVFRQLKRTFEKGNMRGARYGLDDPNWVPDDAGTFMSMEEFTRYRESFAGNGKASLRHVYLELLRRPSEEPIDLSVQVRLALDQLQGQSNLRGITSAWSSMDPYWKWIAQMYGPEMLQKFGGLNVVDPGLLPIGMVGFFRQRRTKWQG